MVALATGLPGVMWLFSTVPKVYNRMSLINSICRYTSEHLVEHLKFVFSSRYGRPNIYNKNARRHFAERGNAAWKLANKHNKNKLMEIS